MASILALKRQVKTLQDFSKVVNIQKIVVMKEVARWQKIIGQARSRSSIFSKLVTDLQKSSKVFPKDMFVSKKENKTPNIPIERDLHFLIQGDVNDEVKDYEPKLIIEFCRKNYRPEDVYIIIGTELANKMRIEGFNIINVINPQESSDSDVYQKISYQLIRSFSDLVFHNATFGFLNVGSKSIESSNFFPIKTPEKVEGEEIQTNELENEYSFISKMDLKGAKYFIDLDQFAQKLILLVIESITQEKMVEYRLAMKLRELSSLDDKEKNIKEEIGIVRLRMQRVRKETVTNELLTNATAFATLTAEEDENTDRPLEEYRYFEEEEENDTIKFKRRQVGGV